MLLSVLEIAVYFVERLALAFVILFAVICLSAGRCHGQVVFAAEPIKAPPNCNCKDCKCDPCMCDVIVKPAAVSVKTPVVTTPAKASVKLVSSVKSGNKTTHDIGSGTVVSSDGVKSKVLTCWHVFRDPGEIKVHLPDGRIVVGRLIRSNSKVDLAIVEFDGSHDYTPFSDKQSTKNLVAYGHEGGGKLRGFNTTIVGYYNYPDTRTLGPDGSPKPGRSGGGLFDASGKLVGVCSGGGPKDKPTEGTYISYPAVELFLTGKSTPIAAAQPLQRPVQNCPTGQCPWVRQK